MRIHGLRKTQHGGSARIAADVEWEDCDRAPQTVFFETAAAHADDIALTPHPFLLAAFVPAQRAGEKRIAVEGSVCPILNAGLIGAMHLLSHWYDPQRPTVPIEPADGFRAPRPAPTARTAVFLSGGVDSHATLLRNLQTYPRDHPRAVRDALFVDGFDISRPSVGEQPDYFSRARASLDAATAGIGVDLIGVRTNLRHLEQDRRVWGNEWFAAGSAAVAHVFGARLTRVLFAAGLHYGNLMPHGSHPELDPYYSSAGLRFVHDGAHLTRLEKMRLVAESPTALRGLRVCWAGVRDEGPLNCGRCHKCVLTMLELLAVGRLADTPTFADDDVTVEMLEPVARTTMPSVGFYGELIEPLQTIGRRDLAAVLERCIRRHERQRG
jgi:hypothetical protein